MRVGIAPSGRRSAADAVRVARLAEDAGLDEVWVSEDYAERGAFTVASAVAAVTARVRVGVGVVNPWTRHVVLTAMESHALDEIAAGRAVIGLGSSNAGWMTGRLGIPFDRPLATLVEHTEALRTLLAGGRVRRTVRGLPVDCALDVTEARPVPLVWGVKGQRALERAATHADGVMLSVLSAPDYVSWVRRLVDPLEITAYGVFAVDPDGAAARERLRPFVARFTGMHGSAPITALAGVTAADAARFRTGLLAGRPAVELVGDEHLRRVTISGDPDDAAAGLLRFRDAGADSLVVIDDGRSSPDDMVASLVDAATRAGLRSGSGGEIRGGTGPFRV